MKGCQGLACSCRVVGSFARTLRDTRLMAWQIHLRRLDAEAAIDLDDDSPVPGAAAMVPADDEPASVRTDKHGGTWSVRRQASNGKSLRDIVKTEWGDVPHQIVRHSNLWTSTAKRTRSAAWLSSTRRKDRMDNKSFASRRKSIP